MLWFGLDGSVRRLEGEKLCAPSGDGKVSPTEKISLSLGGPYDIAGAQTMTEPRSIEIQ